MGAERPPSVWRVLLGSLRVRARALRSLVAWSAVQAVPAFLFGRVVASAIESFLDHRVPVGFAWIAALGASVLIGAWGTRQANRRLAELVEPFRDEMMVLIIQGVLRRSTMQGSAPDTAGVARLTRQVDLVREAYGAVLMSAQEFAVTTLAAILGLFTLVPVALVLVVPPLVLGLCMFIVSLLHMAKRQRVSIFADEQVAEAAGTLSAGLRDVVAFGAEEALRTTIGNGIDSHIRATRDLARLRAIGTVAIGVGGWIPFVLILATASWLLGRGVTAGAIVGALVYVFEGVQPALETLVRGLGGPGLWLVVPLRRIIDMSGDPEPAKVVVSLSSRNASRPAGYHLRVRGLTFAYGSRADPIVHGLNLDVPQGEHLAIVGPSGVGKSTVASLMAGILTPQTGEVTIGGLSCSKLERSALAELRVLIPQEAYVFAGSVWENITYLRGSATVDDVDAAVDRLRITSFVEGLGGYEAEVNPAALSAGEKQLITLVRAYVTTAPILIFDEATCHLDPRAEARLERAFSERPGTLIVIAHRISSALRAQRIVVMDGNQVLAGTHEQLLTRSHLYRDLVGHWNFAPAMAVPLK